MTANPNLAADQKSLGKQGAFSNRVSFVKWFFVAAPGSRFSPRSAKPAATSGPKPRRCKVHNGLW